MNISELDLTMSSSLIHESMVKGRLAWLVLADLGWVAHMAGQLSDR